MKYPMFLGLLFLALSAPLHAQEQVSVAPKSLTEQLDSLMTQKNSLYKNRGVRYRTIRELQLIGFKEVIQDSMDKATAHRRSLDKQLSAQIQKTDSVQALYNAITQTNVTLEKEKNSMAFLGIPSTKSSYRVISWTLILSLLGGLLFFIFKFRNSNFLTQQAKSALEEMEQEFEQHRRWALDREQKLSRELLDERNNKKKK
ncbi:tRNA (guanine-N1)-methyltransferase [Aureicoccus marinus]|jgi:hypothetical protein|uniref:tRNA (Guanine-N1)-methyltransferase n=1 Tax=Aureicoccus marinus TaxID=754435 RepID=A0A2S7T5B3_9FLAO|nr:tRNA (guanine-N1)-methyltransferase [Aureicoccus marinus]PQJ14844.1 hypothetical protein BST99_03030 [Aureicoccus marinus]